MSAVKKVDVVICAMAGNHIRSHAILQQLKLVKAIKEAGNIKASSWLGAFALIYIFSNHAIIIVAFLCLYMQRFLPSEFGIDPDRMEHAIEPGNVTFFDKRVVRRATEVAGIPYTYVSANCFAGYFVGGLAQLGRVTPPTDKVTIYGDGNTKGWYLHIYIYIYS